MNVRGHAGEVVRVDPKYRGTAVPLKPSHIVDAWVMPGGMHMVCLHNMANAGRYVFVLAYVDAKVRGLCREYGLDESLCVDVWHVQAMGRVIVRDDDARTTMRHLAHAAADGAIPFSPIRKEDRVRWQLAVDTLCVLAVGEAVRHPSGSRPDGVYRAPEPARKPAP